MITYKCDVCDKTAPAPTAAFEMRSCPPLGWFVRRGLTKDRHEVHVVVCSKACGDRYDRAEAEEVGFSWTPIVVSTNDEGFKGIFPIKVKKPR